MSIGNVVFGFESSRGILIGIGECAHPSHPLGLRRHHAHGALHADKQIKAGANAEAAA